MRVLFYVLAMMVLANVAVYLWPDKANYAPHVYAAKEPVNPHFVRLNKEIEERFYRQTPGADELSQLPVNDDTEAPVCYRIGPFMHTENYELAEAVLLNAGVQYTKSKRASKSSDVYRVFLGPYQSQAEVEDVRVDLKRKRVLDHFVRKQDEGGYIVSLGIYSTLESADTAVELFNGQQLEGVKKQNEVVVLPDSYWLHFSIGNDQQVREQLSVIDWGEQSAKMGLHSCYEE